MSRLCRYILICLCLCVSNVASSQNDQASNGWGSAISFMKKTYPYHGRYAPGHSMAAHCILNKPQTIDTCQLEVSYTAEILLDTLGTERTKDIVVVQVGDSVMKYYGWVCWQRNINYTWFTVGAEKKQTKINSIYQPAIDYAIYRYMDSGILSNRHLLPRRNNMVYEYKEKLPQFNWTIAADTLTIGGYLCQKAGAYYAGRQWTVWFTSEIPVDCGLWKFNGLPGLILEATDNKNYYHFTLREVSQNRVPIVSYDIPKKTVTREAYRSMEQKIYRHPFSGDAMDFIAVPNLETGKMEFLSDDWEIPYNPIELK